VTIDGLARGTDIDVASEGELTPRVRPWSLEVRWLGQVPYDEALVLQNALHRSTGNYLLLVEHPAVYTFGSSARSEHMLTSPDAVGADSFQADRGGDVTFHGPGQLVAYPIVNLADIASVGGLSGYARLLEQIVIETLAAFGVVGARDAQHPGVWVGDAKVAAIGSRVSGGRTKHGLALNVNPDLAMFGHIVPCGIADKSVTSLEELLGDPPTMAHVADVLVGRAIALFGAANAPRADVAWKHRPDDLSRFSRDAAKGIVHPEAIGAKSAGPDSGTIAAPAGQSLRAAAAPSVGTTHADGPGSATSTAPVRLLGRLAEAGGDLSVNVAGQRPPWMKVKATYSADYRAMVQMVDDLSLTTVCKEAGCPNIYECWSQGTATFMINGERCTRACGFCLVDTQKPLPLDPDEPHRVAQAVQQLKLAHAVITCVARDDLADGGASGFVETIHAIRAVSPFTKIEVLISDCKGDRASLDAIFQARPDVLNHNLETVARLQRAVRPSAGYARSLAVLARAKDAGLTTKSGVMVGLGETLDEVRSALTDMAAVGVDIVTIGQYLRPTTAHLPIARWWSPDEFAALAVLGRQLGIGHVEAAPLVRSSYHAKASVAALEGDV